MKKRRNLIVGYGSLVTFQGITWSEVMRCSFERCSNGVVKKGVCSTHGATRKQYPQKGGVYSLTEQRSSDVALRIRYHGLSREDFE